jgi:AcrR family transcriptional regulator
MVESDDIRLRLLEAAGQTFAEKGFRAAKVRDICNRAGAFPGAVNYHFRSKEQLYVETVKHSYQSLLEAIPFPQWPPDVPAAQRLRDFVRTFLARLNAGFSRWCGQLIMREVSEPSEACAAFVEGFVRPTATVLDGILRDLLPPDVTDVKLHLIAFSIIGQCLHYYHARHVMPLLVGEEEYRSYDVDLLADHVTSFSLAALRGLDRQSLVPKPQLPEAEHAASLS